MENNNIDGIQQPQIEQTSQQTTTAVQTLPPPQPSQNIAAAQGYQQAQYQQAAAPVQPQSPVQQGGEFFVGINLLSKIGVVFIIIGVIAFSWVSAPYLDPLPRTLIIFALGLLMTALGEIFYRLRSKIFARALTLGGIAELFISILIGFLAYESLNETVSVIIGTVVAAGGLLLSYRYNSQTIMAVVSAAAFLPAFTSLGDIDVLFAVAYLLAVQLASLLICRRQMWRIVPFITLTFNWVISITMFAMDDTDWYRYTAAAYIIVSFALYVAVPLIASLIKDEELHWDDLIILISSAASKLLLSLICFWVIESITMSGYVLTFFAVAYLALALLVKSFRGSGNALTALVNITLATACIAIFTTLIGRYAYMVFHVFAAALLLMGFLRGIRMYKIWGYATLILAQGYFSTICLLNADEPIFMLQFLLNAAIWIAIMVIYAVKGVRSVLFSVYSIAVCVNTALLGIYLSGRLVAHLDDLSVLAGRSENTFFSAMLMALIWLLTAFAVNKLKFIGKAAPWASLAMYFIGFMALLGANLTSIVLTHNLLQIVTAIIINVVSVLAALDMALTVQGLAPRFSRAVGLVVSAYALFTMTVMLSSNDLVAFTSCIISVIYLAAACAWIIIGFIKENALLRRFGLTLVLFSSAKLFLFDFAGVGPVERTLMFIGFGIVLLCISFVYVYFEKKLKDKTK